MDKSSNDLSTFLPNDLNTGMFTAGPIELVKGKWYALMIERGLQYTPQITFSAGGTKNPIAHEHLQFVSGGAQTLHIGPSIFYSLVEIKGPKRLEALSESQEVLQIFKAGEVKGVSKTFKDKITRVKTPTFGGYRIHGKTKKLKKKSKKK